MRWWQASAISRPPPSAVPVTAATTGRPRVSSLRSWPLTRVTYSNTAAASSGPYRLIASRSAPAKKVFFAEVTITPRSSAFAAASPSSTSAMPAR